MRRLLPAVAILPFALSGCDGPDLPAEYRQLQVPEARLASAEARLGGRELYQRHCAICHGEKGDGHGLRRLSSRPQDFTDPAWRRRSAPRRVYYLIREGRRGTAMAGWKTLEPNEIWDLVAYLHSLAPRPS